MKEIETIVIEGTEYMKSVENEKYVLLININDGHDFCIRKKTQENGQAYIETLDSNEEFDEALKELQVLLKDAI